MSSKTMLDIGALAFLADDPLSLREVEASLAWRANGPLPDWLDGAEPSDDDSAMDLPTPMEKPISAVPVEGEGPLAAECVETPADGLVSIDDIGRYVEGASGPQALSMPAPLSAARRSLSIAELVDAKLCLVMSAAGHLWAIPLDRVVTAARHDARGTAIDLYERIEGKKRCGAGAAVALDSDVHLIVDRILGPRTLAWKPLAAGSDAADWVLARSKLAGKPVGLLDWQRLTAS